MINRKKQMVIHEKVGNLMAEELEKNMPVTAAFRGCGIRFEICDTDNLGIIKFSYHAPGAVYGQLSVVRNGTDRMYSNFIHATPAEEMIAYLKDPATHREWLDQVEHLSDSVDDFWD